jgi:hypothetical protein
MFALTLALTLGTDPNQIPVPLAPVAPQPQRPRSGIFRTKTGYIQIFTQAEFDRLLAQPPNLGRELTRVFGDPPADVPESLPMPRVAERNPRP